MDAYKSVYSSLSNVAFQMKLENTIDKSKQFVTHTEKSHCYSTKIRIVVPSDHLGNIQRIPIEKKKQSAY